MAFGVYAVTTSVKQGETLNFRVKEFTGNLTIEIFEVPTNKSVFNAQASAPNGVWSLPIPRNWASSLYRAEFRPDGGKALQALFVVRALDPGKGTARIVVSIPFTTWEAYNNFGKPDSIYANEQPDRASSVTFDRSTPDPDDPFKMVLPTSLEDGFLKWLPNSNQKDNVEYCSDLDLHDGLDFLRSYQLLVCIGHDEYWSKEMRDTVEAFAERGGNIAFFTGNTCWWQVRFEDNMRTMVCYRDAAADPLASEDPSRVTVEWSSSPVNRPENSMTGVSFRHGAGCWLDQSVMNKPEYGYKCRFPEHWVFDGTGLKEGDTFAVSAVGYETDAAEYEEVDGIPRVTGRDGTPANFVILATADLTSWREYGQGGMATMGVFRKGGGTVFNAATTNWATKLEDATVARITTNVLGRLSRRNLGNEWEIMGEANDLTAMVACENRLWATDSQGRLWYREPVGQNVGWRPAALGRTLTIIAMASPREATEGQPIGLYGISQDGGLYYRDPVVTAADWTRKADAKNIRALAMSHEWFFAANDTDLVFMPREKTITSSWTPLGAKNILTLTNLNGRLFAVDHDNKLWMRLPLPDPNVSWTEIGQADSITAIAGYAGKLFARTSNNLLFWRGAVAV